MAAGDFFRDLGRGFLQLLTDTQAFNRYGPDYRNILAQQELERQARREELAELQAARPLREAQRQFQLAQASAALKDLPAQLEAERLQRADIPAQLAHAAFRREQERQSVAEQPFQEAIRTAASGFDPRAVTGFGNLRPEQQQAAISRFERGEREARFQEMLRKLQLGAEGREEKQAEAREARAAERAEQARKQQFFQQAYLQRLADWQLLNPGQPLSPEVNSRLRKEALQAVEGILSDGSPLATKGDEGPLPNPEEDKELADIIRQDPQLADIIRRNPELIGIFKDLNRAPNR